MFQRMLLLGSGDPPPDWMMDKVARLARSSGAEVRLELFSPSNTILTRFFQPSERANQIVKALSEGLQEKLQPLLDRYPELDLTIEVNPEPLSAAAITAVAGQFVPDLVVKSCRRHHRVDQYLLGHVDWQLLRQASVPLLLLRPPPWPDRPIVTAAVDPLRAHRQPPLLDEAVVSGAIDLAAAAAGAIDLVHIFQPLPAAVILDDSLMLDYHALKQRMESDHLAAMTAFVEKLALEQSVNIALVKGEPALELGRYCASHHTSIAVMGAVGRSGLEDLFVGSTTEAVLDQLECDLLVIPAAGLA